MQSTSPPPDAKRPGACEATGPNETDFQYAPKVNPLAVGVNEIATLHREICDAAKKSLNRAIRIGELLIEHKKSLKHGQWLPWVKANLPFDDSQARRYMAVFNRKDEILNRESTHDLTFSEAYKLLSAGEKETSPVSDIEPEDDLLKPNSPCIPKPGHGLACRVAANHGGWFSVFVMPSINDGFFFVNVFFCETEAAEVGGSLDGTVKAIRQDALEHFISRMANGASPTEEDHFETDERWTYNEFLFNSHQEYVEKVILGKRKEEAQ